MWCVVAKKPNCAPCVVFRGAKWDCFDKREQYLNDNPSLEYCFVSQDSVQKKQMICKKESQNIVVSFIK